VQVFRQMNPTNISNSRAARNDGLTREHLAPPPRGRTRVEVSSARVSRSASTHAHAPLCPVAVFIARAEARAILWQCGEFDLHEGVDVLQADAEASGLVTDLGQYAVQEIIAKAFGAVR
jgi:hypothetical protein